MYFSEKYTTALTAATDDMCWLLSRGYAGNSALQLVGNRYKLNKRQRSAVSRICCSEADKVNRAKTECTPAELQNETIEIDGFNLLIWLESALSGAFTFKTRDGLYRDISSVHGSYKRVVKTEEAIITVGRILQKIRVAKVKWYLDKPISNSGRLKTMLAEIAVREGFDWEIELVYNPDKVLAESKNIVVSSDGWILDRAENWFNLNAYLLENELQNIELRVY